MARRPYVLLSAAMSADGYIDDASPRRLVLSGAQDLDRVDEERARSGAIMVGAQTVRSDNPRLLIRSAQRRERRQALGLPASPVRVTITASGDLDPAAAFFADNGTSALVYAAVAAVPDLRSRLSGQAEIIGVPDRVGLAWVLADLGDRGIGRLMIEGGARLLGQALADGLADELQLAIAPVFVADPAAPRLLAGAAIPGAAMLDAAVPGAAESGAAESGAARTGRMVLAGTSQAGDVAVLRYLLARLPGS